MKTRGVLIAGNWKMNRGPREAEEFFAQVGPLFEGKLSAASREKLRSGELRTCVAPPFLSLERALSAAARVSGRPIDVAAQNAHWEKSGAFTGEVSGGMLKELGIGTVIIGHSERRQFFGETDETCRKRTVSLLGQGFRVILCIGETRAERESNQTAAVLTRQLTGVFLPPSEKGGASEYLDGRLVIAYEPVWAIGTGLTASPQQAEEAHQIVRKFLWDQFGMTAAGRTPVLYGGSVTPENVDVLLACANVDGALVGGASLKPESFTALVEGGGKALSAP